MEWGGSSVECLPIGQVVISGDAGAVAVAIEVAKRDKRVRRAVLLDVSAPFHCALMAPAATQLREYLDATLATLHVPPTVPVVWNVDARASPKRSAADVRDTLVQQVVAPVRWSESVDFCVASGAVDAFVEVGYGGVLTGLIKQHAPSASVRYDDGGGGMNALESKWVNGWVWAHSVGRFVWVGRSCGSFEEIKAFIAELA